MRQLQQVEREQHAMEVLVKLTGVFEGIASMKIAGIKNQVTQATLFFEELWQIYTQLRVDNLFRYGRSQTAEEPIENKELYILITAEGGFSGDIDHKLIDLMKRNYQPDKHDILVIGHHGAIQLAQQDINFIKYYKMPDHDQNINVSPLIKYVQRYRNTTVYYQQYISLMVQDVKKIELAKVVQEAGKDVRRSQEIISEETYIFEPSTFAVVDHLERSMLQIALSQLILDSKLAQYASRFQAMTSARQRANDANTDLKLAYNRTKRAIKDERIKEVVSSLRAAGAQV